MKQDFIKFLDALMAASPEVVEEYGTESVLAYVNAVKEDIKEKTKVTEKGAMVLRFMRESDSLAFKTKDIADALGVLPRTLPGVMHKLVNDGYVEKLSAGTPAIYSITEEGKNINIDEGEIVE